MDADPQCDISKFILTSRLQGGDYDEYIHRGGVERTLFHMLEGFHNSENDYNLGLEIQPETIFDGLNNGGALFLLPGHEQLDRWDSILSGVEFGMSTQHGPELVKKLGGPYHAIKNLAESNDIDFVLIDMNPGKATLTKLLFMCCDYFVIPTKPESFSKNSIMSMTNGIVGENHDFPSWLVSVHRDIVAATKHTRYPVPQVFPKFLGYVISDYHVFNYHGGELLGGLVLEASSLNIERWMGKLHETVISCLPALRENPDVAMAFDMADYKALNMFPYLLCKVKDYEQLQGLSHEFGIPVQFLQDRHCLKDHKTTGALVAIRLEEKEDMLLRIASFRRNFDQLVWNMLSLIALDGRCEPPVDYPQGGHRPIEPVPDKYYDFTMLPGHNYDFSANIVGPVVEGLTVHDFNSMTWTAGSAGANVPIAATVIEIDPALVQAAEAAIRVEEVVDHSMAESFEHEDHDDKFIDENSEDEESHTSDPDYEDADEMDDEE